MSDLNEAQAMLPSMKAADTAALTRPRVNYQREVWCVLGLPFDAIDVVTAVQRFRDAALSRTPCFVSTPNLNFLVAARSDEAFRSTVLRSDLSVADGMPLVWVARTLGIPIPERVAGASIFEALSRHAGAPLGVYFFGGPEGSAAKACEQLNRKAGGLHCVGYHMPGFGSVESMSDDATLARINASGASFVVVSLGAKKGQAWIEHNRARLDAPLLCHLGAVVNFVAGSVSRAPPWMQRLGLEWLWRVKEERGLWRRYSQDGGQFASLLFSRVLPYAMYLRTSRPSAQELNGAKLVSKMQGRQATLVLQGAWTHENLQPLRDALTKCDGSASALHIDLHDVIFVDSAFIGLLLLARGRYAGEGHLSLSGASLKVAKVFHYNAAEFLLKAADA
jgi:N-acetylglucosaminyldiphosphoundecaprenol N-acetyl-beta-D-mannosaminyltransferase